MNLSKINKGFTHCAGTALVIYKVKCRVVVIAICQCYARYINIIYIIVLYVRTGLVIHSIFQYIFNYVITLQR